MLQPTNLGRHAVQDSLARVVQLALVQIEENRLGGRHLEVVHVLDFGIERNDGTFHCPRSRDALLANGSGCGGVLDAGLGLCVGLAASASALPARASAPCARSSARDTPFSTAAMEAP